VAVYAARSMGVNSKEVRSRSLSDVRARSAKEGGRA
jgi:hypothetical protein